MLFHAARVNLTAGQKSGLRLSFLLFLALGLELPELLRSQDRLGRFHIFGLARFVATRLLMLGHGCVHLCLLIKCEIEVRQRNRTRHLRFVSDLLCAVAMFAREHRSCRKESRRYYRNEFGHSGSVRHRCCDFHSKSGKRYVQHPVYDWYVSSANGALLTPAWGNPESFRR